MQPRTSSGGLFTSCVIWARAHAIAPTCRSTISLHKHRCMEARKYYTTRVSCRLFISFCFRAQLSPSLFPSRYNACRRGSKSATPDSRSLICPIVEVRERAYTHIYGRVRVYIYRESLFSRPGPFCPRVYSPRASLPPPTPPPVGRPFCSISRARPAARIYRAGSPFRITRRSRRRAAAWDDRCGEVHWLCGGEGDHNGIGEGQGWRAVLLLAAKEMGNLSSAGEAIACFTRVRGGATLWLWVRSIDRRLSRFRVLYQVSLIGLDSYIVIENVPFDVTAVI